jgi:hypothetical protein
MSARIETPLAKARRAQLASDVRAFDAMCAARPFKPPPLRLMPHVRTAAALALARDVRLGVA